MSDPLRERAEKLRDAVKKAMRSTGRTPPFPEFEVDFIVGFARDLVEECLEIAAEIEDYCPRCGCGMEDQLRRHFGLEEKGAAQGG